MPTLDIGGRRVKVDDAFLKLSPEDQQAAVEEIAASLPAGETTPAAPAAAPISATDVVRSAGTGVPVIGGLLNQANAITNATVAPLVEPFLEKGPETLDQPTWNERRKRSLEIQEARDKKFAAEHPVVDTVAKVAGGVAGTVPMVMAAPTAFGATGPLLQQMRNAAASGAALSGADAAVRGEDVVQNAAVGGGLGLVTPPIAKGIGKAVQSMRPAPAPVVQNTASVAGVDVPLRPDQVSGNVAAAAEAEAALRGAKGERAQGVAQTFEEAQNAKITQAAEEIAAGLDSTGASRRTAPQDAGAKVVDELIDVEARRLAGEQAATRAAEAEGTALRSAVGGATDPFAAAETVGAGVAKARNAAVAARDAAYGRVRDEPGTFDPETIAGLSSDIRARLAAGPEAVTINPQNTPQAHQALGVLDSMAGTGLFQHTAPRGPVGPVAEAVERARIRAAGAVERPAPTEAEAAYESLIAQGVNPARARAAVEGMEGGEAVAAGRVPNCRSPY